MPDFIERRVYYHDTDAGGVVYYTSYLEWFEEARAEYFLGLGFNLKDLGDAGIHFVVASVQVSFKSPAFFYDRVRITTATENVGSSSISFRQKVFRDRQVLVDALTTVVCISDDFRPRRIPDDIRRALVPEGAGTGEGP